MIHIELTQEQAQHLAQLVEIAMRAGGVPNIRVGQPLYDIIEAAIIQAAQPKSSE